ncbi:5-(carboxyamino)imidazole ribonucleotide synthase [Rhabdothermincola salaria]|uniref:5-(carboxyamino)imidazole ribonucleotide synthase n=1 Tax=Rhabdothermincola salaria TaxID=2903142 RepID=UPI001E291901|nr:5-(carboxyamino)imidazole ribonucleotide synthase [Rhabdothermincola salaria]
MSTSGAYRGDRPSVVVVGAGQLARMTAAPAAALDIELRVLAATPSDCATAVIPRSVVGDWDDDAVVAAAADGADVITFDHELVDSAIVARWEAAGHTVHPGSATLAIAADKAAQRAAMVAAAIPVPDHGLARTVEEVAGFGERFGWPLVVKAARGGYDGRGVWWLAGAEEAAPVLAGLPDGVPLVVEPVLDLAAELAVQVARTPDGRTVTYPAVRTYQRDGICHAVVAPSGLPDEVEQRARQLAEQVAEAVDAVGMLAVEFFWVGGEVLVNELAPRAHNSGHYSIEACDTSQFENHLRSVLGLPLGSPALRVPAAAMVNVLGGPEAPDPAQALRAALAHPEAKIHLYGKDHRPGRKLGHVTVCGDDPETVLARARAAAAALVDGA